MLIGEVQKIKLLQNVIGLGLEFLSEVKSDWA